MAESLWGVEVWGPEMTKVWGGIRDTDKRLVKAYGFNAIPETVTEVPSAISFLYEPIDVDYSAGGRCVISYRGKTEFFLSGNVIKSQLNKVFPFIKKIVEAAAQSITLNGKVDSFLIQQSGGIEPAVLSYGDGIDRYGLVVTWEIQETVTGKIVVHD